MATIAQFDKFYNNFPTFTGEADFFSFWQTAINEVKKISMKPEIEKNKSKSSARFDVFKINYQGYEKSRVYGDLYVPVNIKKPRPVIILHDYNSANPFKGYGLLENYAYLFLKLRGHNVLNFENAQSDQSEKSTPGYMQENLLYPERYYLKGLYLDVYRAVDFLRLNNNLTCDHIPIIAKGLSCSAALFTAAFNKRINLLYLDSPGFIDLENYQNLSNSDAANEVNNYIANNKRIKKKIKSNLTYFDGINFSGKITSSVMTACGLRDTISPSKCTLGLFHSLEGEKIIEIYPDDNNECGGKLQFQKALKWIKHNS